MSSSPPLLTDDQALMLDTIYGLTTISKTYDWPTVEQVSDYLYRVHDVDQLQPTWSSLPVGLVYPPAPTPGSLVSGTRLRLSLAAVLSVLERGSPFKLATGQLKSNDVSAGEFTSAYLELVRKAAMIERDATPRRDGNDRLTHRNVPNPVMPLDMFMMLSRVLDSEPLGFTEFQPMTPNGSPGWSMKPTPQIRPYRRVATLEEYLLIRASENPTLDRDREKAPQQDSGGHANIDTMSAADQPDAGPPTGDDPRKVFLVHGRNAAAETAMREFLYALDLDVMGWTDAANEARGKVNRQPYTLEIVTAGLQAARAVVVLFTPDDLVRLDPRVSPSRETDLTGQARPNVILEAGMILGMAEHKALFVRIGNQRSISDIDGINFVNISNSVDRREDLVSRLRVGLGLPVTHRVQRWLNAGDFDAAMNYLSEPRPFERGSGAPEPSPVMRESLHWDALAREIESIVRCAQQQGWQVLNNSRRVLRLKGPRGQVRECWRGANPGETRQRLRPFAGELRAAGLRVNRQVRQPVVGFVAE